MTSNFRTLTSTDHSPFPHFLAAPLIASLLMASSCSALQPEDEKNDSFQSILNLAHLDHLGQDVELEGVQYRIIHIYAEAPDYNWVADQDEGAACVDDAARAAVVYLRHFELTGDHASREKAESLLRFIMYMQREDGLFYNFVWGDDLRINESHPNSRAEPFGWWASRAIWALGTGAYVLRDANPQFALACVRRIQRALPHLDTMLDRYPSTISDLGRQLPRWLVYEYGSDATSELMLGLVALNQAEPDVNLHARIDRFAQGIALMQYGSMNTFPFGAHASWRDVWHGWGNSQTQALAEAGILQSAFHEADHFYPKLLVDGWMHSMSLSNPSERREFEQIAYAVRCVTVGLIRLFEATQNEKYAVMAGLAASWFTGNNVAGRAMYHAQRGYGYDGINGPNEVNLNSGAESTVEALLSIMEVERHPEARRWLHASGEAAVEVEQGGKTYRYRLFSAGADQDHKRIGLVMNLTDERVDILEGEKLQAFLGGT